MKNKVGIATVTTGHNYGTSLQAYSTKEILSKLGFEGELLKLKGSFINGRDIRLKKLLIMFLRSLLYKKNVRAAFSVFIKGKEKKLTSNTKSLFNDFSLMFLTPKEYTWKSLTDIAKTDEYISFVCGSDQVWNANTLYVDPLYYLEFAPTNKRVAFTPSFGSSEIASYNKSVISKKLSSIKSLSVREESGCNIIYELTGRDSICLIDPTLVLSKSDWSEKFNIKDRLVSKPYILFYFLDKPSISAESFVNNLKSELQIDVIGIPYKYSEGLISEYLDCGPVEFLNLVYNARFVVTDSFHGTAFSLNFGVPFATFERNYGVNSNQSSRIISLLEKVGEIDKLEPSIINHNKLNVSSIEKILEYERKKSLKYLKESLT